MTPLDAAASLVRLEFQQSYGLGFVAPNGRIVTCYHVVADEPEIIAHLADGRALPVKSVCAIDHRRDLAVLDVGLLDATPVRGVGEKLFDEGQRVHVFGMVPGEDRARWADASLASLQVVASSVTIYKIEGDVPMDASGGPLIGPDGAALGVVVTMPESDEEPITIGVPWRYVEPLLRQHQQLPLSALASEARKPPTRQVPEHPLTLLEGSAPSGLEATTDTISEAIRIGAPAYNAGDVNTCFQIYAETAKKLIATRDDCAGVQTALRAGLARAATMSDIDHQAWAMRDAFDGLLIVIEKYLRANLSQSSKPTKPTFLN